MLGIGDVWLKSSKQWVVLVWVDKKMKIHHGQQQALNLLLHAQIHKNHAVKWSKVKAASNK